VFWVTRDIAIKFNEQYGETFVIPEPQIRDAVARVPGIDGEKMSKSYGNTIETSAAKRRCGKKVMAIKMDSRTPAEPKPDNQLTPVLPRNIMIIGLYESNAFQLAIHFARSSYILPAFSFGHDTAFRYKSKFRILLPY
jgi:tryptophanyl-tRNA synthetase